MTAGTAEVAPSERLTQAVECADLSYRFATHLAVDQEDHAGLAAGDLQGQPAQLRGRGPAGLLIGTATTLWLDTTVMVGATIAAITCAAMLLPRLANR